MTRRGDSRQSQISPLEGFGNAAGDLQPDHTRAETCFAEICLTTFIHHDDRKGVIEMNPQKLQYVLRSQAMLGGDHVETVAQIKTRFKNLVALVNFPDLSGFLCHFSPALSPNSLQVSARSH
jgi:hypothetical protein